MNQFKWKAHFKCWNNEFKITKKNKKTKIDKCYNSSQRNTFSNLGNQITVVVFFLLSKACIQLYFENE